MGEFPIPGAEQRKDGVNKRFTLLEGKGKTATAQVPGPVPAALVKNGRQSENLVEDESIEKKWKQLVGTSAKERAHNACGGGEWTPTVSASQLVGEKKKCHPGHLKRGERAPTAVPGAGGG